MTNNGIVNIHGKEYMTVAKRVELAHKDGIEAIDTEVLQHAPVVVVKATVKIKGKTYTGISSANPIKAIEKSNPYEVAETSAVGRALGFANYGIIEGIASADEMAKAGAVTSSPDADIAFLNQEDERTTEPKEMVCATCGQPAKLKSGIAKTGKPYAGVFCSSEEKSHTVWR